jgi:hypothetical protein
MLKTEQQVFFLQYKHFSYLTSFVLEFKPEKIFPMQLPKVVLTILIPVSLFVARSNALAQKTGSTLVTGKVIIDGYGAIIRGNLNKKEIALVLTGDEFADMGRPGKLAR